MQNHISKLNRKRVETFSASLRSAAWSLCAVLLLAFGVASVQAQQDSEARKKGASGETVIPISPVNTRTRTRRTASSQPAARVDAAARDARQGSGEAMAGSANAQSGVEVDGDDAVTASKPAAARIDLDAAPVTSPEENGAGRIAALRAAVEEAATEQERARAERTLVDYLVAMKRDSEAVAELRSMMREERLDPVGFYNVGNALARLGDNPTAVDAYRKAIAQRHGNYSRALNNLGVVLMRLERWDEADEALNDALKQENFHYPEARRNLTRLAELRGRSDAVALPAMQNPAKPIPYRRNLTNVENL